MARKSGYDESSRIRLRGVEGIFAGRECQLRLGQSLIVGRSATSDFFPTGDAPNGDQSGIKKMSRHHFKISFCNPEHIEIEDLSKNGTFLNGKRIDRIVLKNLQTQPAVLDILAGTVAVEFPNAALDESSLTE